MHAGLNVHYASSQYKIKRCASRIHRPLMLGFFLPDGYGFWQDIIRALEESQIFMIKMGPPYYFLQGFIQQSNTAIATMLHSK